MENNKLEANAIADLAAAGLNVNNQLPTPFILVPEGYQLRDLENMLMAPMRKQGTVTMQDPASFIDYVNTHKTGAARIYGTVEPSAFIAVLNDHDNKLPGWKDYRANYTCPKSKEWNIWTGSDKKAMGQVAFSEFIENNLVDIVVPADEPKAPSGADMLQIATTFRAQKKVAFQSGTLLSNGQVQFQYVEDINGQAGPKGQINVPEKFFVGIPVFENGDPYKIEAKLRWRLQDGGALSMWYELVRPHKTQEAAFMDVWNLIGEQTGIKLWRGTPAAAPR
jgi:uncharacterized protein YfdQ (DUF2303 family)